MGQKRLNDLLVIASECLNGSSFNRHADTVPKAKRTLLDVSCRDTNYQSISRKLPTEKD